MFIIPSSHIRGDAGNVTRRFPVSGQQNISFPKSGSSLWAQLPPRASTLGEGKSPGKSIIATLSPADNANPSLEIKGRKRDLAGVGDKS